MNADDLSQGGTTAAGPDNWANHHYRTGGNLVQLITPDPMRGRVKSFDQVFMSAGTYLGHAQMGTAATFLGIPGALILGGGLGSAAVLLVAKFARSLRNIDN